MKITSFANVLSTITIYAELFKLIPFSIPLKALKFHLQSAWKSFFMTTSRKFRGRVIWVIKLLKNSFVSSRGDLRNASFKI